MSAPANVIQIKERRTMDLEEQARIDYYNYRRALRRTLSPSEYMVLDAIIDAANEKRNEGWCWPSLDRLMADCGGMARHTVIKAIEELARLGLIVLQRAPRSPRNQQPNYYKPMKRPEGNIMEVLDREWCKKDTARKAKKTSSAKNAPQQNDNVIKQDTKSSSAKNALLTPSSAKNDSVVVQKMHSNVTKEENVYKKEKGDKQVAPPQPEKQPVNPDALAAYNLYCSLFKRACDKQSWFDFQVSQFGRKAVMAAITRCYEKSLKSSTQLRSVLERQTPQELAEFDDNGQRISKPKPPQKSATYPASSRFTPVDQLKRERNSTRIYD